MRRMPIALVCLLLALPFAAHSQTATLLYITDAHEVAPVVDRLGDRGGIARLKTVVDMVRAEDPQAKLLFGGDLAGGVLFGAVFRGLPTVEALGRVGVDLATFGQHDFDFGASHTEELIQASRFPWFTSNLVVAGSERPFAGLEDVAVLEANGLRVGLIGLTDAMETSSAGDAVEQLELLKAAGDAVTKLNRLGVDAIVALTQAPLEVNESILIANPEIDAIFSEERSETHSSVWYVDDRPIASPGGNLASVARLELTGNDGGIERRVSFLVLDPTVPEEAGLKIYSDSLMAELERRLAKPVAETTVPIESGMYSDSRARWGEANAGNLIADAFRAWYDADVALVQGGGIRASLPAGTITKKSILSLLPFNNRVLLIELSGEEIRAALEYGISAVADNAGRFLQVGGLEYSFNPTAPVGERLVDVRFNGKPLKDSKRYTVALTEYLQQGGEGFEQFRQAKVISSLTNSPSDAEVLETYLAKRGTVSPMIEGRITRVEKK